MKTILYCILIFLTFYKITGSRSTALKAGYQSQYTIKDISAPEMEELWRWMHSWILCRNVFAFMAHSWNIQNMVKKGKIHVYLTTTYSTFCPLSQSFHTYKSFHEPFFMTSEFISSQQQLAASQLYCKCFHFIFFITAQSSYLTDILK